MLWPRHGMKATSKFFTESEFAILDSRTLDENIAFLNFLTTSDDYALVIAAVIVSFLEVFADILSHRSRI